MNYYDRQGNPVSMMEFELLHRRKGYKRIRSTVLPDGKWISTVWLGINHNFGEGELLIFETMVFPSEDNLSELDVMRYGIEEEAIQGHEEMVKRWSNPSYQREDGS